MSYQDTGEFHHCMLPPGLTLEQKEEFKWRYERSIQRAIAKYGRMPGYKLRSYIISGIRNIFVNGFGSREQLRRRVSILGQRGLRKSLARDGWQTREYFTQLGRKGGKAKAANRLKRLYPERERSAPVERDWRTL